MRYTEEDKKRLNKEFSKFTKKHKLVSASATPDEDHDELNEELHKWACSDENNKMINYFIPYTFECDEDNDYNRAVDYCFEKYDKRYLFNEYKYKYDNRNVLISYENVGTASVSVTKEIIRIIILNGEKFKINVKELREKGNSSYKIEKWSDTNGWLYIINKKQYGTFKTLHNYALGVALHFT